jgi:uncharacterized protein
MASRLVDNIVEFGRLLRRVGMTVGPAQLQEGLRAAALVGLPHKEDFYWALATTLITRPEHRYVFDQAFQLFWRSPDQLRSVAEITLAGRGDAPPASDDPDPATSTDLGIGAPPEGPEPSDDALRDKRDSASEAEVFTQRHFEHMDSQELARAKRKLEQLELNLQPLVTRRRRRDSNGAMIDWRRSQRALLHGAPKFAYASRRQEPPALVLLCDISGSMQLYSRVLLHFLCAVGAQRKHTYAFLFGTRLTNITRLIRTRDIGGAVDKICRVTRDFDGGTRIGAVLAEFNRKWSRRLLGRKPVVVLVTDGLEGEAVDQLQLEIDRLHRSCGRLLWLNPLLRYEGFEPKAAGIKTIIKHVDSMHAVHSVKHIADVVDAIANIGRTRGTYPERRMDNSHSAI